MNDKKPIVFQSDKVKVNGARVDGSYTITFEVGEYEQLNVAGLLLIPQQKLMKVTVEVENE